MSLFRPTYRVKGEGFRSPTWWIQFRDHRDVRRKIRAFSDRRTSEAMQEKLKQLVHARATASPPSVDLRRWCESLAPRVRATLADLDILDRKQIAAAAPLENHLVSWLEHLAAKGTGEEQRTLVHGRAKRVIDGCGFESLADVAAEDVERYLRALRDKKGKNGNPAGIAARTSNHYLQAIREFMGWAVRTGLLAEDPLRVLRPMNAECDRRRERRALTPEELRTLLAETETAGEFEGVSGPTRALLYRVASETGLRYAELRSLVVADLDLADTDGASVRVRAASAKNRREARLPLRPATAAALKDHLGKALPLAGVFGLRRWSKGVHAIRADLALAKIPEKDDAGRVIDFHSLRVTFATNLARGRVPLQLAQRLMRHSDPRLTSSVYTVLGADDEREAVAALPESVAVAPAAEIARATGTDGTPIEAPDAKRAAARPAGRASRARKGAAGAAPDAGFDALRVAWDGLDQRGRAALLQTARVLTGA